MNKDLGITLQAELKKVSTTIDGGWSITFHVDDSEAANIMTMSQMRDTLLQLAVVKIDEDLLNG